MSVERRKKGACDVGQREDVSRPCGAFHRERSFGFEVLSRAVRQADKAVQRQGAGEVGLYNGRVGEDGQGSVSEKAHVIDALVLFSLSVLSKAKASDKYGGTKRKMPTAEFKRIRHEAAIKAARTKGFGQGVDDAGSSAIASIAARRYGSAKLSTATWEGLIDKIESSLTGKVKKRERLEASTVNLVYFDQANDGTEGVFKPNGMGYPIGMLRSSLNPNVTQALRECVAFDIDRLFGFGVIPPTVLKTSFISQTERADVRKRLDADMKSRGLDTDTVFEAFGDDFAPLDSGNLEGSSQLRVDGKTLMELGKRDIDMAQLNGKQRFSLQKIAVFDYVTGNTDRHSGNLLFSEDGNVYAIDNGMVLPRSTPMNIKDPSDMEQFISVAAEAVRDYEGGKIDNMILEQLRGIKEKEFKALLKRNGLENESQSAWVRLQALVQEGHLSKKLCVTFYGKDKPRETSMPSDYERLSPEELRRLAAMETVKPEKD